MPRTLSPPPSSRSGRLVIHIGLHKTGTKTIQRLLAEESDRLHEAGVRYASVGRRGNDHRHLALQAHRSPRYNPNAGSIAELLAEIEPSWTTVISSELFSTLPAEEIPLLREVTSGVPTEIIVYLRRQDLFAASLYGQWIKVGRTDLAFDRFLDTRLTDFRFNYWSLVSAWSASFGTENVTVRPLEREQLVAGSVEHDLLTLLGVDTSGLTLPPRLNVAPSLGCTVVTRELQRTLRREGEFDGSRFVRDFGVPLVEADAGLAWSSPSLPLLDGHTASEFLATFAQQNERVAREHLGRDDGRLFFNSPDPEALGEDPDISDVDTAAAVELLTRLALRIKRGS